MCNVGIMAQHMLSDAQYNLLTAQDNEITHISQEKGRIIEKVDSMFNTFRIINNSKTVDQAYKDEVFGTHRVTAFISNLTQYDDESTSKQEEVKQEIILDLMRQSLTYFQQKYKQVFIKNVIKTFEQFAEDILDLTRQQIEESEAQKLYHTRRTLVPPLLYPKRDTWSAVCIQCHRYSDLGGNEDDAIKRIHHSKNCSYFQQKKRKGMDYQRIKLQYFCTRPPEKKR